MKKYKFLILLFFLGVGINLSTVVAQDYKKGDIISVQNDDGTVMEVMVSKDVDLSNSLDEMPLYPGGNIALNNYLKQNIKYPKKAMKEKVEGTAFVSFLVNEKGAIKDVTVIQDPGHGLGKAAKKVIKRMPNWIPAQKDGEAVSTHYTLPVRFEL